jgi:integrase
VRVNNRSAVHWPGTKNGTTHRMWLPEAAQALIRELADDDDDRSTGFVFSASGRHAIGSLDVSMRKICAALGVDKLTPHDLRRTHGTLITGLGFGRDAMNRIQNHREGGIADVYDQYKYTDENQRVMETVAQRILALAEGRAADNVVPLRVG